MKVSHVNKKQIGSILEVTLCRADVRNAMNPELIKELTEIFVQASSQNEIRGIFLFGEGSAFCAGADINYMQTIASLGVKENQEDAERLFALFESVYKCEKPVVTFVQGACFGGGLGLLACSDFVIADPNAQFCFSEVKLGLAPSVISHFIARQGLVPQLRGEMLTARVFTSLEAQNKNLVHQVASVQDWPTLKETWQKQLQSLAPKAFTKNKTWLQQVSGLTEAQSHAHSVQFIAELRASDEGQEGLKSFLKKTKPSWIK